MQIQFQWAGMPQLVHDLTSRGFFHLPRRLLNPVTPADTFGVAVLSIEYCRQGCDYDHRFVSCRPHPENIEYYDAPYVEDDIANDL